MSFYTHQFDGLTPPKRSDSVAWSFVRVWEAPLGSAVFVEIDVIAWPNDPTPASPNPVDLTLTTATLPAAQFRFQWDVDDGVGSNPSTFSSVVTSPDTDEAADGSVASYVKLHLGGNNWDVLVTAPNFGFSYVQLAVEAVKRRVLAIPVLPAAEPTLDGRLLDYLGLLTAIQLLEPLRSAWASREISRTAGNDPVEITTFTNRSHDVDLLREGLMRVLPMIQSAALPLLDQPTPGTGSRPVIDELDDVRVLDDPREFPPASTFPYPRCI